MEATKDSTASDTPAILFEPFTWVHLGNHARDRQLATFAALAGDVARGVQTIVALAEHDDIAASCGDADGKPLPLLMSKTHHGALQRLACVSLDMLAEAAEKVLDAAHKAEALRKPG